MKKHFFSTLIICILLFILSAISVSSESVIAYTEYGYATRGYGILIDENSYAGDFFCPDLTESWSCLGDITDSFVRETLGVRFYCASNASDIEQDAGDKQISFFFDVSKERFTPGQYNTMRFAASLRGGLAFGNVYDAEVKISAGDMTYYYYITLRAVSSSSELYYINVDISNIKETISSVSLSIAYSGDKTPYLVKTTAPVFIKDKKDDFVSAGKYMTGGFKCSDCEFDVETGTVTPEKNDAVLSGSYSKNNKFGGKSYFVVRTHGLLSGTVSLTVNYSSGASDTTTKAVTVRLPVFDEIDEYVFPVSINGYVSAYSLGFSGITTENGSFLLESVSVTGGDGKESPEVEGSLVSLKKNGNTIRFSGNIDRKYVKDYPDRKIVFCAYSLSGNGEYTVLGSTDITTQFSYSADISSLGGSPDTYKFTVAIEDDDGNIFPIAFSRYCEADRRTTTSASMLGFADSSSAEAFEANASAIILDVPLDQLLLEEQAGALSVPYSFVDASGTEVNAIAFLNKKILKSLDSEISFCESAGMKVFFRFTSRTPIQGLTYVSEGAENYSLYFSDNSGKNLYCAIVGCLSGRYPGLSGFVLGYDTMTFEMTGAHPEDRPAEYFGELAEISRLTYNSSVNNIKDIVVVLPASEKGEYLFETAMFIFSDSLDTIGSIPWVLMYVSDDIVPDVRQIDEVSRITSAVGIESFYSHMIIVNPDWTKIASECPSNADGGYDYAAYCSQLVKECCDSNHKAMAVFLSLAGSETEDNIELCFKLKEAFDENGNNASLTPEMISHKETAKGVYRVFDFSDKHYLMGWIGAGLEYLGSDYSKFAKDGYDRVLRAENGGADSGAGILLCNLESSIDMSDISCVGIELAVKSEDDSDISLIFVIGNDTCRAEFSAVTASDGEFHTYCCDLSEYDHRDKTDFIGIVLYTDVPATLELGNVTVQSDVLNDEEVKELFVPSRTVDEGNDNSLLLIYIGVVAALICLGVLILLIKHDKDSEESANRNGKE